MTFISPDAEKYDEADKKKTVIATKWNPKQVEMLKDAGMRLRQVKKSTIIKELVLIGYAKVVQEQKMLDICLDNYRRNKRLGIHEIEAELKENFNKSNSI